MRGHGQEALARELDKIKRRADTRDADAIAAEAALAALRRDAAVLEVAAAQATKRVRVHTGPCSCDEGRSLCHLAQML
jgi:hypothetical protein